jgi:hypothetical protein
MFQQWMLADAAFCSDRDAVAADLFVVLREVSGRRSDRSRCTEFDAGRRLALDLAPRA